MYDDGQWAGAILTRSHHVAQPHPWSFQSMPLTRHHQLLSLSLQGGRFRSHRPIGHGFSRRCAYGWVVVEYKSQSYIPKLYVVLWVWVKNNNLYCQVYARKVSNNHISTTFSFRLVIFISRKDLDIRIWCDSELNWSLLLQTA